MLSKRSSAQHIERTIIALAVAVVLSNCLVGCDRKPTSESSAASKSQSQTRLTPELTPASAVTAVPATVADGFKTVEECNERYGEATEVQNAPSLPATEQRLYQKNDYYLWIDFIDGIAHRIRVYRTDAIELDNDEIEAFLESNKGDATWEIASNEGSARDGDGINDDVELAGARLAINPYALKRRRSDNKAFAHFVKMPSEFYDRQNPTEYGDHLFRSSNLGLTMYTKFWKDRARVTVAEQERREKQKKLKKLEGM